MAYLYLLPWAFGKFVNKARCSLCSHSGLVRWLNAIRRTLVLLGFRMLQKMELLQTIFFYIYHPWKYTSTFCIFLDFFLIVVSDKNLKLKIWELYCKLNSGYSFFSVSEFVLTQNDISQAPLALFKGLEQCRSLLTPHTRVIYT